jgi:hypothetical protein
MNTSRFIVSGTAFVVLAIAGGRCLQAQDPSSAPPSADGVKQAPATVEKPDPTKRQLSDKEKFRQQ